MRRMPAAVRVLRSAGSIAALALLGLCPSALAANLYVTNGTAGTVSQFAAGGDGALSPLSPASVPTNAGPQGIAVSPNGKNLYTANFTANTVTRFPIAADGTVASTPAQILTVTRAQAITFRPDGLTAYVTSGQLAGFVAQFSVASDGTLTPLNPATVTGLNTPGTLAINAAGTRAYAGNNADVGIAQYAIAADGTLSALSPALVASGGTQARLVALSPDGSSLYAGNTQSNSVSQFTVAADGTLSLTATYAAGSLPRGIAVSADGMSVYTTNSQNSASGNSVSQYTRAADGSLTPKSPATVATGGLASNAITLSTDGHTAYVTSPTSSTVSQFTVGADGSLTAKSPATVPAGTGAGQMAFSSGQAPAQVTPTLSTVASGPVSVGGQISATATLADGASPTGTITFHVYGPGDTACASSLFTGTAAVTGNGAHFSGAYAPPVPGTYRWTATYGGDAGNTPVGPTSCSDPAAAVSVAAAAPAAITGAASSIAGTGASLSGTVDPNTLLTTYVFEYGPTLAFGSITAPDDAGVGDAPVAVSASATGLAPHSTYYYRLVASSSAGTTFGAASSFTTTGNPLAPATVTLPATSVTNTTAGVAGQVNPNGQQTTFTFEYGTTTAFGQISTVVALDDANAAEPVSATLSGLTADTTYFYRVVAANATGTSIGVVRSFTTGPGGAPIVTTTGAGAITATGATLGAIVDPHGLPTAFAFEYGTTNAFGSLSAVDDAGSAGGPRPVALAITGLAPGTRYRFRIVATNASGTTVGTVGSFTTAAM